MRRSNSYLVTACNAGCKQFFLHNSRAYNNIHNITARKETYSYCYEPLALKPIDMINSCFRHFIITVL